MDYDEVKKELVKIAEIASAVPDNFKEKCFEILLSNLLQRIDGDTGKIVNKSSDKEKDKSDQEPPKQIPLKAKLRVFMQKYGVTEEQLHKVLMYEDNDIHYVLEPKPKEIARGQIEWALMIALKKAIVANIFEVDPEEVRSMCQDKGFYDRANFFAIFKRSHNAILFKGALKTQGDPQLLSDEGERELSELIKSLAGSVQ